MGSTDRRQSLLSQGWSERDSNGWEDTQQNSRTPRPHPVRSLFPGPALSVERSQEVRVSQEKLPKGSEAEEDVGLTLAGT